MDINAVFINVKSDFSEFEPNEIEIQDDFSKIIAIQVDSIQQKPTDMQEAEEPKGKKLPLLSLKKESPDVDALNYVYHSVSQNPDRVVIKELEDNEQLTFSKESVELKNTEAVENSENLKNKENQANIKKSPVEIKSNDSNKEFKLTPHETLHLTNLEVEKPKTLPKQLISIKNKEESDLHSVVNTTPMVAEVNKLKSKQSDQFDQADQADQADQIVILDNDPEANKNTPLNIQEIKINMPEMPIEIPIEKSSTIQDHANTISIKNFEKEIGERLVDLLKVDGRQVTLKINPPELGKMDINLELNNEIANLSFYTSSMQVKLAIEASMSELKNLFGEQNLSLGEVQVFHQGEDSNNKRHPQELYETREHKNLNTLSKDQKEISNPKNKMSTGTINLFA